MTTRWTTEDIARELHLGSRASARKWVQRHRDDGVVFRFDIDELSGEKYYHDSVKLTDAPARAIAG